MAFRFKRKESLADGFARIAGEQLGAAVSALEELPADGVHEARKAIKHLRGLLRLFRHALPEGSSERENAALRDAAHFLAGARDATVRAAVFDSIARGLRTPGLTQARRGLRAAAKAATTGDSPVKKALAALRAVGTRLPRLPAGAGWSVLRRGLKLTYRRARKAHAEAHAERTTTAIHRWRRRSNDFAYQMQLLRKIDPSAMKRRLRITGQLTDFLGDDHDLAVLTRTLTATPDLPAELRDQLTTRIARRRKKLQRRAFQAGSELFFEKPAVVIKELDRQWKQWRRGTKHK